MYLTHNNFFNFCQSSGFSTRLVVLNLLTPNDVLEICLAINCCFFLSPSYAVIAFGCASCPKITCGREGCGTEFCYHCKQLWHPNQTCDTARQQRAQNLRLRTFRSSSLSYSQESGAAGNTQTPRLTTSVQFVHVVKWQLLGRFCKKIYLRTIKCGSVN